VFSRYAREYGTIACVVNGRPVAKSEAKSVLELLDSDSKFRDMVEATFKASLLVIRRKLEEASKRPSVAPHRRK
jgi:hypothetical protein